MRSLQKVCKSHQAAAFDFITTLTVFRPRSLSRSSTSRNEREYRSYPRTAQRISSGSVCRHLKIAGRIVFCMISSSYQPPWAKVAT